MNDYKFNIGDEVITIDGIKGTITDICECERCQARGFCEPVWVDEENEETFITDVDAKQGFTDYYKIGNYYFNALRKDLVEKDISRLEELLATRKKQLQLIEKLEQKPDICPKCGKSNYRVLQGSATLVSGKMINFCVCLECGDRFSFVE